MKSMKMTLGSQARRCLFALVGLGVLAAVVYSSIRTEAQDVLPDEVVVEPATQLEVVTAVIRTSEEMEAAEAELRAAGDLPEAEIPFRPTMDEYEYKAAKAAANAAFRGSRPSAPSGPLGPPTIKLMNIAGVDQATAGNLRPPDTHGATGRNEFCQIVNSHLDCYLLRAPFTRIKSISLASFFGYVAQTIFDPRIVYDTVWNRWVVYAEAFAESGTVQRIFIGISLGPRANAAYYIYNIDIDIFDNGDFWDYGQLGMNQDCVILSANIFNPGFVGARMFSVAKALLYNGLGFSVPVFSGLDGTLAPPIVLDQNFQTFLVAALNNSSTVTKYTLEHCSYPNGTTLVQSSIPVPAFGIPANAAQPGTAASLDSIDNRFVNAGTQIGDSVFQVHTTDDFPGVPTPRWYEFDVQGAGANTVKQSGNFFASATSNDWMASIGATTDSKVYVVWSSTDPTNGTNAQVRISGRLPGDAPGVITAGSACSTSPTFYDVAPAGGVERWGDYSAVSLAPKNPTTRAHVTAEEINTTTTWGTRICRVGFP